MTELTICIAHFRKLAKLQKTIEHIENNTRTSFLVKILNQGYLDLEIKHYLAFLSEKKNYQIIYHNQNIGPSAGRNILFQDIKSPVVLSLDDDIYLPPDWFENIGKFLRKHEDIDVIGLSLVSPDKQPEPTAHYIDFQLDNIVKIIDLVIPDKRLIIEESFFRSDYVSEGAMVLRTNVLKEFAWDPELTVCFEGFDAGMQFRKNSIQAALFTGITAIHDSVSRQKYYKEYNSQRRDYHKIRKDYLYICNKWQIRFPLFKHIFYSIVCRLLPNILLRSIAFIWLNRIKPFFYKEK